MASAGAGAREGRRRACRPHQPPEAARHLCTLTPAVCPVHLGTCAHTEPLPSSLPHPGLQAPPAPFHLP